MISVVTSRNREETLKHDFDFFLSEGKRSKKTGACESISVLGRFRAVSYNDMMQKYHDMMGYGPYVPLEEEGDSNDS
jgi:hypothetical protein